MRYLPRACTSPLRCGILLLLCSLGLPALAIVHNVKTGCGATGNGTTDDTAAIKTCIGQLASGDTLEFPAGTYKVTSQLSVNVTNITIDGSSNTATIKAAASYGYLLFIGSNSLGSSIALSTTANELATSFTTTSSLGVAAGDLIYLHQGGKDSSGGSGDTGCDQSGCRGEVVQVQSVSGNTVIVTTALHDTYNPSVNAAVAQKMLGVLSGVTVQNITFDGSLTVGTTLAIYGSKNASFSGVTVKNGHITDFIASDFFGLSVTNMTATGGDAFDGTGFVVQQGGSATVNGLTMSGFCCTSGGVFPFWMSGVANSVFTGVNVDASGTQGRPAKTTASRYNTFNSLTVKNGINNANGLSLEYYSSHNTFNNCDVENNSNNGQTGTGQAGIATFGNFNQYNTFSNCTVKSNGNVQILVSYFDALRLGQDSHNTFTGNTIGGCSGCNGIVVQAQYACVNNNSFLAGTGLTGGITVNDTTSIGSGNVLNGLSSNLTAGTCQGGSSGLPAPPSGLVATVQ